MTKNNHKIIAIAPMMGLTDIHFRYLMRLLSKRVLLFTEMVVEDTIINGDREKILSFNEIEHPVALQIGGKDEKKLAICSKIGEDFGYDEINFNVGCPSKRVKSGSFGAYLMQSPEIVEKCIHGLKKEINIPVSIKTRIGLDNNCSYNDLKHFVKQTSKAGCSIYYIHARKGSLKNVSTKKQLAYDLEYNLVYRLKEDFPNLTIVLNGGITHISQFEKHLELLDGIMIGREAYKNPYMFKEVDHLFFDEMPNKLTRNEIATQYLDYAIEQIKKGTNAHIVLKPLLKLWYNVKGAKAIRHELSNPKITMPDIIKFYNILKS